MTTIFLDTSALCKSFVKDANGYSKAHDILEGYKRNGDKLAASKLLDIEMARIANRYKNGGVSSKERQEVNALYRAYQIMVNKKLITFHDIDDEVINTAKREFTPHLKSLDAIHTATMYLKYPSGIMFSHDNAIRKTCEDEFGMKVCPSLA